MDNETKMKGLLQKYSLKYFPTYLPLLCIFLFALFIRLIYNLTVARRYYALDDASLYNHIAYNIVYHRCFCIYPPFPAIGRAPLWPYMLSIIYRLTPPPNPVLLDSGLQVFYGRLLSAVIGSLTCALVYLLARDLFGKRIALVCGIIASVYTGLFIYDGWIYTESLFTCLLLAFIYSLLRFQLTRHWRWVTLSGILFGLIALTRPNGPLLFAMICLWALGVVWAKIISWQTAVKSILLMTCIAVVMIAPWTYRNYRVFHAFIPVAVETGDILLGVYNDNVLKSTTGIWTGSGAITPRPNLPQAVLAGRDTAQYTAEDDQIATDYALHWIELHWKDMPRLFAYHFIQMWIPFTPIEHAFPFREHADQPSSRMVWYLVLSMPIVIYLLSFFGLLFTWQQRKKELIIVYIVIAMTIAQNIIFWGDMRFRAPIEPLLVLLVGGALWWLTSKEQGTLRYKP